MKKSIKTTFALMLVLATIVTSLIPGATAKAGNFSQFDYQKSYVLAKGRSYRIDMTSKMKMDFSTKVTIKSSNKSVLQYTKEDSSGFPYVQFYAKKTGTTNLTITLYSFDGTKETYTTKIKVMKYQNPVKSIKIAGKQFAKTQKKETQSCFYTTSKSKVKIAVTPAKGWKIKKIYQSTFDTKKMMYVSKTLKKNPTVKIAKKSSTSVYVILQNSKTKQIAEIPCIITRK